MSQAVATYRFEAAQAGDLSFEPGDNIMVLEQSDTGWWLGRTDDGREGIFPYNRVKLFDQRPVPALKNPVEVIDRINRASVRPVEPIRSSVMQEYTVELILSNNKTVQGTKSMKHFRVLNHALNKLGNYTSGIGGFYKSNQNMETAIPEWADDIKLPSSIVKGKIRERAEILSTYLSYATGDPQLDFLIVYWLDPNASFSYPEQHKRTVAEVYKQSQNTLQAPKRPQDPELAKASYAWVKRDDQEISFQKGEIIAIHRETQYTGWWNGEKFNGGTGLFPYNYVAVLPPTEAADILHPSFGNETSDPALRPQPSLAPSPTPLGIAIDAGKEAIYKNTVSGIFTTPGTDQTPRARKRVTKYSLCSTEAFDELLQHGVTIEENGQLLRYQGGRDCPKGGDTVTLLYSGFIWAPQKQELLEFTSSDQLLSANSKPKPSEPLRFTIGKNQAIDGIEEAVQRMKQGQSVRITLTPEKAYGDVGFPPDIPGNAYLVYDLTLKEISHGASNGPVSMQGAAKSSIQPRQLDDNFKTFMGSKSMRQVSQSKKEIFDETGRQRVHNLGGNADTSGGIDSETFKKKLSLDKLQDIVRRNQYMEYAINPALIEEYLTDDEFSRAFEVDHFTWLLMPAYKRKQLKQKAKLV